MERKKNTEQAGTVFSGPGSADQDPANEKSLAVVNKLLFSCLLCRSGRSGTEKRRADMSAETAASGKSAHDVTVNVEWSGVGFGTC